MDNENNEPDAVVMRQKTLARPETKVTLEKIGRVLNDIAYLTGLGLVSEFDQKSNQRIKKSSPDAIDAFMYFVFEKFIMDEKEKKLNRKHKSVLKTTKNGPKIDLGKHSDKKSDRSGSKSSKKSDKKDEKAKVIKKEETKQEKSKEKKAEKKSKKKSKKSPEKSNEKEVRILDSDSESGSEEGSESEGESDGSKSKSEHEKNDFYENEAEPNRLRTILFEDEKYEKQKQKLTVSYEDIQEYL